MSSNIGYIRVSTVDQNTDRQLDGVDLDEVFEEKVSAATTKRPKLKECLRYVRKGDTLHVHSIDRLARNLADLLSLLNELTGKGVAVKFHKENLTFTGEENNPFQTLQLQIIGAVAQFEREIIKERQREGIAKAQAKGKHCGRKAKLTPEQVVEIKGRIEDGEEKKALAIEYGVSRQTLYRVIAKH
ncbi:recombinase family protein [Pseudodesulfovibrio sediminis]|uniref:Resolvase n=1 Tax=Pseudodesulfovibrio sediminis TaxID=2810563 RepID=A0ABN6EPL2_9BACT|nr:recombinase family protein [Pseudodesulfovibrio sediminis]BCS87125.1 resolvase [Pseudodesulfovibrio sediminis]